MTETFLNYVKAGYALLWVRSSEEARVLADFMNQLHNSVIENDKKEKENYSTYVWDIIDGVVKYNLYKKTPVPEIIDDTSNRNFGKVVSQTPGAEESSTGRGDQGMLSPLVWMEDKASDNTILFLRDFHTYLKKDCDQWHYIVRKIRNLLPIFRSKGKTLVIVAPTVDIPAELEKEVTVIDFKLPERGDLKIVLNSVCSARVPYPKAMEDEIIDAALGMTVVEAENAFSVSLVEAGKFDSSIIRREKALIVKKTGLLEVVEAVDSLDDVGGLENLKEYLNMRKDTFTKEAKEFGVSALKGILLAGVSGCGKSLIAKAIASAFKRPLLRLDMGKIFGKYVGESEGNMNSCLDLASAVSPSVLWIDELEKSMAGNNANAQEGHETTRRVFQLLLTWLQEKKSDVLLVATANSIASLPPELLRAGRIDSTWWVDLPDAVQREEILKIHIKKAKRDPSKYDLKEVVTKTEGFSGAELEVLIKESLVVAFGHKHKDVTVEDIVETIPAITPVSKMHSKAIEMQHKDALARGIKDASKSHTVAKVLATTTAPTRKMTFDGPKTGPIGPGMAG
jgi:SpoVK/Ycf46/Vps4 family AAA+-type ATPase